jgi:hypothetical protein
MLPPSKRQGGDSDNDVLPVDSLGLPILTQPPNLFTSLYERGARNFSSLSSTLLPLTSKVPTIWSMPLHILSHHIMQLTAKKIKRKVLNCVKLLSWCSTHTEH